MQALFDTAVFLLNGLSVFDGFFAFAFGLTCSFGKLIDALLYGLTVLFVFVFRRLFSYISFSRAFCNRFRRL